MAEQIAELVSGAAGSRLLLIADHASNRVPDDVQLGIPAAMLDDHIALDIGAGPLSRALAERLGCPALLAAVSRLVVDLNRDAEDPAVIPAASDGIVIPGNASLDEAQRELRILRFWTPYHQLLEDRISALRPAMLIAVHSFTPQLASRPEARPWQVGILYNHDERAARIAIAQLRAAGVATGDNQPYSGRELNATMNRHAETRTLPYLGIEVRQDLIADPAGVQVWADQLAPVVDHVARTLACGDAMDQ